METVETSGRTVEDAVARALAQLGRRRDQVDVEVVHEGSRGFLGIGGEDSTVRVTVNAASSSSRGSSDRKSEGKTSQSNRRRGRRGRRNNSKNNGSDRMQGNSDGNQNSDQSVKHNDVQHYESSERDDDDPPRRDEFERRESNRRRGRQQDRRRSREGARREPRPQRSIEPVSEDQLTRIPGTPPNLPEIMNQDPEDHLDLFGSTLRDLLMHLGFTDTSITARDPETAGDGAGLISQVFDVYGDSEEASEELAVLIGRRGETLNSLQYLLNVLSSRHGQSNAIFGIDIDGYRRRREETLIDMAQEIADEVRTTGDVITLEPMPAAERRIIHLALEEEEGVSTESIGRGRERQIEVLPE